MSSPRSHKYRAAIDVLQKGREILVDELADTVLDQAEDLLEGGYAFHEFLENQGTRLHFLCLLLAQLEQSAELHDDSATCGDEAESFEMLEADLTPEEPEPVKPPVTRRKRTRSTRSKGKKLEGGSRAENSSDEV